MEHKDGGTGAPANDQLSDWENCFSEKVKMGDELRRQEGILMARNWWNACEPGKPPHKPLKAAIGFYPVSDITGDFRSWRTRRK